MLEVAELRKHLEATGRAATPIVTFNAELDRIRCDGAGWQRLWAAIPAAVPWQHYGGGHHAALLPALCCAGSSAAACRTGYYPKLFYPKVARVLAEDLLPRFTTAYYLKNFKGAQGGAIFRCYPGPFQIFRRAGVRWLSPFWGAHVLAAPAGSPA